jgi:hypothetical protein
VTFGLVFWSEATEGKWLEVPRNFRASLWLLATQWSECWCTSPGLDFCHVLFREGENPNHAATTYQVFVIYMLMFKKEEFVGWPRISTNKKVSNIYSAFWAAYLIWNEILKNTKDLRQNRYIHFYSFDGLEVTGMKRALLTPILWPTWQMAYDKL